MVDEKECEKGKRKEPQERMWESEWDDMKKRKRRKISQQIIPKFFYWIILWLYPVHVKNAFTDKSGFYINQIIA